MNDPLHDPLAEDPLGDQPEFEVKEEPFEFFDDSCSDQAEENCSYNGKNLPAKTATLLKTQKMKNCSVTLKDIKTVITNSSSIKVLTTTPIMKIMTEKPSKKVITEKPSLKVTTEKSSLKVTTEKPSLKVTTEKSNMKVSTEKPSIKVSTEKLGVKVSTEKPSIKVNMERPSTKVSTERPNIKEKVGNINCQVKKETKIPFRKQITSFLKRDNEARLKRELERQLSNYRANIKRMQKILDEEKAKMTKVQNSLVNLRRRLRRRELKMMSSMRIKETGFIAMKVDIETKSNKVEREVEVKNTIKLEDFENKKRKRIDKIKVMKRKKFNKLLKFDEVTVKEEEVVQEEERGLEIKKTNKKGVVQEKKKEQNEQANEKKQKKKLEEAKGGKRDGEPKKVEVGIKTEVEEKNVKPEIQIATSHMLWNVLSRNKVEPYLANTLNNIDDVHFPLQPHVKPNISDVPQLVKEFVIREDISKSCTPSSDSTEKNPELRYRMHYLLILHKQFIAEHGMLCNYQAFANYVPRNVVKPSPRFWKTCTCYPCLNPELKFEKFNMLGLLQMNGMELGDILHDTEKENSLMAQLRILRESRDILSYDAWERTCSGTVHSKRRSVSEPVGIVVAKFLEELSLLKSHIQRTFCQLEAAKQARERAMHSADEVTLHVDCTPVPVYRHTGSEPVSADIVTMLTVLTGYLWSNDGYQSVVVMSDSKDYTTAAVWAGLEKILLTLVQVGKNKINIISDSPTNRYRNKSNFYYMSDFAHAYGVCFRWVFLELSHGIGHAGLVRSDFDHVIRDQMSINVSIPVRYSCDVLKLVQAHTSSVVHIYTDEDVQKYKCLLPKLRVVQGTQKFHEVIILPEDFWVRDVVSHDAFRKLSF
ncbi:uncharacterized protein LOC121867307 isoform X2 [Homarus americanus]|uniref:uncharacterized protein LOC121867307 isoform X2 n=1 Tax=Homarus americanus TaxID=6706 RepID=UPI001C47D6D6|nr:uncharacterized protein LOC121867307 isoform X2 [Homarus americanus]